MAAFSSSSLFQQQQQHHQSFLIDSVFLPNSPTTINTYNNKMCSLFEEPNNTYSCFPQFFLPADHESPPHQNLDHIINCSNNDDEANSAVVSVTTNKNSTTTMDSSYNSIVTDYKCDHYSTDQVMTTITDPPMEKKKNKRKSKEGSSPNSAQSKDKREVKEKKQKKMKDCKQEIKKAAEEAPTGYIHVRARRGQATDSHSLAERVRREKISERMKLLQALVPGCDKVTGKALMLDEIINYVQSLQNQVEFLSMKLASVNPMSYDFGVDLESFMVRPDQDLSELPSPMVPNMQECNPTTTTNDHYHLMLQNSDNSIVFQQSQIPNNVLPQGSNKINIRQSLWEVDEHRQKISNQSGLSSNLFSFH